MNIYYFGCWKELGHYLWNKHGYTVKNQTPWQDIDAFLCPNGPQIQGVVKIHHKDGWTAMAFWDRSVDKRPGSNSVFIAEGIYTFEEMKNIAEKNFLSIWKRLNFKITEEKRG